MSKKNNDETTTEPTAIIKPATTKKPTQIIYMGYSFAGTDKNGLNFMVEYGTIFSNGLPEPVAELCKTNPDLNKMFIPVAKTGEIIRQLEASENQYKTDPQTKKQIQIKKGIDSDFTITRKRLRGIK